MLFHFLKKLGFYSSSFFFIFICWEGWTRIPQTETQESLIKKDQAQEAPKETNFDLKQKLSQVLSLMAEIHESIKKKRYQKFQNQISNMIEQLNQINVFRESQLTYHQRNYLSRRLHTIKENLRFIMLAKKLQGPSMQVLRKVNRELIHISQMYSLHNQQPQQYSVYFCSQTESTWIQKSNSKVYNPFQKGYQNCGRKIR